MATDEVPSFFTRIIKIWKISLKFHKITERGDSLNVMMTPKFLPMGRNFVLNMIHLREKITRAIA